VENEGHSTEWLLDPEAALEYAAENSPDLILLDLGIAGRDGLEVLTELRARGSDAVILVLTGRSDLQTRIQCLDAGADDCLLKPFSFLEFTARCRALLRRRWQGANSVLRHGELELQRIHHRVLYEERQINLTAKEFALLEYLMLHRGENVSRSELLSHVWKAEDNKGTNIVDVYINYLRRKLESTEGGSDKDLIQRCGAWATALGERLPRARFCVAPSRPLFRPESTEPLPRITSEKPRTLMGNSAPRSAKDGNYGYFP